MWDSREKILVLAALVVTTSFVVSVFVISGQKTTDRGAGAGKQEAANSGAGVPANAFLPAKPQGIAGGVSAAQEEAAKTSTREEFQTNLPSLEEIKNNIASSLPQVSFSSTTSSAKNELLTLPAIADSEIAIDPNGTKNALGYFEYLAVHYKDLNFDYRKINDIIDAKSKLPPSVVGLIDEALAGNSYGSADKPLGVLKEFVLAKIEFEKSIKVAEGAISTSRTVVGLDRLAIDLIDRFNDLQSGAIVRNQFEDFYAKYKNTNEFYNNSFLKDAGLISYEESGNMFSKILGILGFGRIANAKLPLGGMVFWQTYCTCSFVGAIMVGPPVGGNFALPLFFVLYSNFSPTIGHYVLGLYSPAPIPCLQYAGVVCIPDLVIPGTLGPVIMMGTS
jgi:hypothetical protein